jgi:TolA-binding protein
MLWTRCVVVGLVFAFLFVIGKFTADGPDKPVATSGTEPVAIPLDSDQAIAARQPFYLAVEVLGRGQVREARRLLQQFLDRNPQDAAVQHAEYWLGQTYLLTGDFTTAGRIFTQAYETDKNGPMVPDILRALGTALASLQEAELACATFAKIQADFPNEANQVEGLMQQRDRAGCR